MDILGEYEKQNPQPQVRQVTYGNAVPSEGLLIRMVMKLSGGKVQDRKQAGFVLAGMSGIILLIAISVFIFTSSGSGGVSLPYEKTYHPIQSAQ